MQVQKDSHAIENKDRSRKKTETQLTQIVKLIYKLKSQLRGLIIRFH